VMVGLHTCGDLATTMMRVFATTRGGTSSTVMAVLNVGCCYNLLSEGARGTLERRPTISADGPQGECECEPGFPLSRHVQSLGSELGRTVRAAAAQSTNPAFASKHMVGGTLRRRALLRATLQLVLHRHLEPLYTRSNMTKSHTNHVWLEPGPAPDTHITFAAFCVKFVQEFPLQVLQDAMAAGELTDRGLLDPASRCAQLPPAKELDELWNKVRDEQEGCFGAFRAMQHAFTPLVEALILMDRVLFLMESGDPVGSPSVRVRLFPLFDPKISPRNMCIYASREGQSERDSILAPIPLAFCSIRDGGLGLPQPTDGWHC